MSDYVITRKSLNAWRVCKFDNDALLSEYEVRREPEGNYTCDCPRWMRKSTKFCRHTTMIQADVQVNPDRPLNEPFSINYEV